MNENIESTAKDFKYVVDCIFVNRSNYKNLTDEDKIKNFFIINRKFAKKYPKVAKSFNHKNVDKASAIDRWFLVFEGSYTIPSWYWDSKKTKEKKVEKKEKKIDIQTTNHLIEKFKIKESDIDFLKKYYPEEISLEIKKIK